MLVGAQEGSEREGKIAKTVRRRRGASATKWRLQIAAPEATRRDSGAECGADREIASEMRGQWGGARHGVIVRFPVPRARHPPTASCRAPPATQL